MTTTRDINAILKEVYKRNKENERLRLNDRLYFPDLGNKAINKTTRPKDNLRQAAINRLRKK